MSGIRERLEQDLDTAVSRLRRMDGAVALEEAPGPITSGDGDEFDEISEFEGREIGFATRAILLERVHRIQTALDRLKDGEYGTCVECGERIAPARLHALPEVQTCVRCQDRIERMGRHQEDLDEEAAVEDDD